MTRLFAIADERFLKREELYESLCYYSLRYAAVKGLRSSLLYFGKKSSLSLELARLFDEVFVTDFRVLQDESKLDQVFSSISFGEGVSALFCLHHDTLTNYLYVKYNSLFSKALFDVCDFDEDSTELSVLQPVLQWSYYKKTAIEDNPMLFIRTPGSATIDGRFPDKGSEIESIDFRFRSKAKGMLDQNIDTNFIIAAGEGLEDKKYYTRFISSISEKMKGAGLACDSLVEKDPASKWGKTVEQLEEAVSDFCLIAAEEGSFDVLEFSLRQKHVVYIGEQSRSVLHLAAHMLIDDDPKLFLECFNSQLKKVSFKAKKISKK